MAGMTDTISRERRSRNMSAIRSKGMRPELAVRKTAHRLGFRFRLQGAGLPGKPDLVFSRLRKVIFVHGCFWHQHQDCRISRLPKSNQDYWLPKLSKNVQRDHLAVQQLEAAGWMVERGFDS